MVTDKHVSRIDLKHASKTAATTMTLLVLLADTPVDAVKAKHGDYHDVFSSLFARSAEQMTRDVNDSANASSLELIIKSYDVVNEPWEYPSQEEVRQATGLLITGSAASAYEDKPWINRLVEYTASLPSINPKLKLVGICYGHQIIARAFGGVVEKNAKGWELGVRNVQLTELGRTLLLGSDRGETTRADSITIHQVHQDHVPELPKGFALLGSTPVCAIQGMVAPAAAITLEDVNIFTLQGHPEFSPDIVTEIINVREKKGILTSELAEESRGYAKMHDEGVSIGAKIIRLLMTSA